MVLYNFNWQAKKNANTFKDFNLAGNLVRKLPVTPNKFNKNLMK